MKNLLQNLLILFALGLCVLLAFQWHREGVLREQLQRSDSTTRTVSETIEALQSDVGRLEAEIARVEGLRKQLSASATAREQELARLTLELQKSDQLAAELESFKAALARANENIKVQNESLEDLANERNELAERYNQLAEDYNALVNRWNEQQAALTNSAPSSTAPTSR
jgi:chromosome segregation ATPase